MCDKFTQVDACALNRYCTSHLIKVSYNLSMKDPKIDAEIGLTYAQAGVDIDAGNLLVKKIKPLVRATARAGSESEIGGFGGLFDLRAAGFHDPILVAANDGVGTKLKIAIDSNQHETIGIDLVAMCVNDLIVQGAEPLFFLDYFATSKLDPEQGTAIISGIASGCREAGCALIGGETAEMPDMYQAGDYDLAGFAVGAAERDALLPKRDLRAGDIILGLRSSGIHSNGFSLVRRIVKKSGLAWHDKAPFQENKSLATALLEPTRLYVRSILHVLRTQPANIKALAHITGGGLDENIPRILPPHLTAEIDLTVLSPQPVFHWLARTGNVAMREMLRTFNCGIGMIVITSAEAQATTIGALEQMGEKVSIIGSLVPSQEGKAEVIYQGTMNL